MIEFSNVTKRYDNGTRALENVSMTIERGEFVFIVGSSGAGKSTLIKLMLREEKPTSGIIHVNGFNLNKIKRRQLTLDEIEKEAAEISKSRVRHILMLTGEAPGKSDFAYLKEAAAILKKYFDSVSVEVYPLSCEQYAELKEIGVDVVLECTGFYCSKAKSQAHIDAGANESRTAGDRYRCPVRIGQSDEGRFFLGDARLLFAASLSRYGSGAFGAPYQKSARNVSDYQNRR